jgi:hypothetical protein
VAAPPLDLPCDRPVTYPGDSKTLTKSSKGRSEPTLNMKIIKEIKEYRKEWLQHVQTMETNRMPKQALPYRPKGRRNIG